MYFAAAFDTNDSLFQEQLFYQTKKNMFNA